MVHPCASKIGTAQPVTVLLSNMSASRWLVVNDKCPIRRIDYKQFPSYQKKPRRRRAVTLG
jgi:hypothetical protein